MTDLEHPLRPVREVQYLAAIRLFTSLDSLSLIRHLYTKTRQLLVSLATEVRYLVLQNNPFLALQHHNQTTITADP